jgi:hypothetical protein
MKGRGRIPFNFKWKVTFVTLRRAGFILSNAECLKAVNKHFLKMMFISIL